MDILLVDLRKRGYRKVGKTEWSTIEEDLLRFCELYANELKDGKWLFVASGSKYLYKAEYRATYSDYDLSEPYYIDVAENDERVMFHRCVNFTDEDRYTCVVCHETIDVEDANAICQKCIDKL